MKKTYNSTKDIDLHKKKMYIIISIVHKSCSNSHTNNNIYIYSIVIVLCILW